MLDDLSHVSSWPRNFRQNIHDLLSIVTIRCYRCTLCTQYPSLFVGAHSPQRLHFLPRPSYIRPRARVTVLRFSFTLSLSLSPSLSFSLSAFINQTLMHDCFRRYIASLLCNKRVGTFDFLSRIFLSIKNAGEIISFLEAPVLN